jgi:hypothetical protein
MVKIYPKARVTYILIIKLIEKMIKKVGKFIRKLKENNRKIDLIERRSFNIEKLAKENDWNNVFNSAIVGSTWFNNIPLNVGRWAGNYSLFYTLYRILNEIKPENILEFGLGETTKMIQAYKQYHNINSFCITIEQSEQWIDMRLKNDISSDYILLIKSDIDEINVRGYKTSVYKDLPAILKVFNKRFDLILIDGPVGSENYSRYNIIELINQQFLSDNFIIIIDDYNRRGEQQTVEDLKETLTNFHYDFFVSVYSGNKDNAIIGSPQFQYLKTI